MLDTTENQRLEDLLGRFKSVAKRRHAIDTDNRRILLERAAYDVGVFAAHMVRKYGSGAFPAVIEIADFLRNNERGAPKYIDIALCPLPPEKRVPFVPAEYIKRSCAQEAQRASAIALASFE